MKSIVEVLVFAEFGWRNGGENSWLAAAELLRHRFYQFTVACPSHGEFPNYLCDIGIPTVPWNLFDSEGLRLSLLEIRDRARYIIEKRSPDLIHCNSLSTTRIVGPVSNDLKVPSVGYLRDIIKISQQAMADVNRNTKIIAVSKATLDFHVSRGLDSDRSVAVFNGVDLGQFKPTVATGEIKNELNLSNKSEIALCIGQIGLRKGTETVIQAFLRLCSDRADIHLLVIGIRNSMKTESIEFEKRCHRLADDSVHSSHIHWLGRRNDVWKIMKDADILLHGARQEPLGRVLIEAMASGLPFVATDVGGTREITGNIQDDLTICEVDNPSSMHAKAKLLLEHDHLRAEISKKFRERAKSTFDIRVCAEHLHNIYRSILTTT